MTTNYERVKKCKSKNYIQFNVALNKNTDADIIAFLDALPNKRAYVLGLIRDDVRRKQA